jgi:two-component system chemotaxis response regulator CheY
VSETKPINVLIVDDSKTMTAMIAAHLKNSTFKVVATASNGREALEKYQAYRPHVVLLDIVMPEENGVATLERILHVDSTACVVMVSSMGTEAEVQDCLKKGAKTFLQKPLNRNHMVSVLTNVWQGVGEAL